MAQAFKRGDRKRLSALLPQAKGHPLEPWAAYWELKARLDEASTQEVRAFLNRYPATYQEDRLRNDWLLLLGQRRDWTTLSDEHQHYRMRDDRELRCYFLTVELLEKGPQASASIADEVRKNWMAMKEADDGCTLAADRLYFTKQFKALDIWRKARLMAEHNRPRTARNAVQIVSPADASHVNDILAKPLPFLNKQIAAPSKAKQELVVLALVKLATTDTDKAANLLRDKWRPYLTAEERHWVWGVIGRQSAMRLEDEALSHFARVANDKDLNDDMLGWKVRAALRAGNTPKWPVVESTISHMSAEARKDPTWIYWYARALLAHKKVTPQIQQEANALLESIAGVRGFYEQLALEELGRKVTVPARPDAPTADELEAARRNPSLQRALYAIGMGLRSEGVREWNYGTNLVDAQGKAGMMSDRELLAAAQVACDNQVWDRCINTSERTRTVIDFEQRFPMPHKDAVIARSKTINLDPAYVYGLIRQESRFVTDARSHVGAAGLMQVMPATAKWTARKIGLNNFTPNQINDRDTNIAIGTGYLKLVLDSFEGSMPLAAGAYNAGPSRSRRWRAPNDGTGPVLEGAIWAENVPFNETRDYVKKVLSNTTNYAALITGQPQSLKAKLGLVGPRSASAPAENLDLP
ncbi:MAG TPA: transglycosylase SLT domain-containing protein [Limnohabitans sp.]|uniref:lytic transglycosylase domain-containing protein n=1 Tax=Limnohabitans sp. TaxID=1907725 RepID=UPI002BDBBCAE|nr:transglycosylase SLT domain-containing protein [Limnohabitans sp.]HQR86897.1 transglycosylase SLT domain-containing protein [Limnohabitans sp.]HQS27005.1 transglycosylase SLT domain-containing protein [Limnohabitans sp.]